MHGAQVFRHALDVSCCCGVDHKASGGWQDHGTQCGRHRGPWCDPWPYLYAAPPASCTPRTTGAEPVASCCRHATPSRTGAGVLGVVCSGCTDADAVRVRVRYLSGGVSGGGLA